MGKARIFLVLVVGFLTLSFTNSIYAEDHRGRCSDSLLDSLIRAHENDRKRISESSEKLGKSLHDLAEKIRRKKAQDNKDRIFRKFMYECEGEGDFTFDHVIRFARENNLSADETMFLMDLVGRR